MKKERFFYISLLCLFFILNIVLIFHVYQGHRSQEKNYERLQYLRYKISLMPFLERCEIKFPKEMEVWDKKFAIIFPEGFCSSCQQNILLQIKELEAELKQQLIAIVPVMQKQQFEVYNKSFDLGIKHVLEVAEFGNLFQWSGDYAILFCYSAKQGMSAPLILDPSEKEIASYMRQGLNY